jgi:hypothetical protein
MRLDKLLGKALIAIAITLIIAAAALGAGLDGATLQIGTPVTKAFTATGTIGAQGGNATTLNATTETQTLAWQGFYGELFGNISLEDNSGNAMYRWSSTTGTILASTDININFANITAVNDCSMDDTITGSAGSDSVNKTFTPSNNTEFTIGSTTIAAGTACTTYTYVNNATQTTNFEEIIVTDDGTTSIYATRIDSNTQGFNGNTHDFQMIVPDYTNQTTLTYYFYVQLG